MKFTTWELTSLRKFRRKVKEVKPEIVGMSGVLTLALESMKQTVDALKEAGVRDEVKVIIGGNPVTKEACEQIGADAFTTNAAEGVKYAKAGYNKFFLHHKICLRTDSGLQVLV